MIPYCVRLMYEDRNGSDVVLGILDYIWSTVFKYIVLVFETKVRVLVLVLET